MGRRAKRLCGRMFDMTDAPIRGPWHPMSGLSSDVNTLRRLPANAAHLGTAIPHHETGKSGTRQLPGNEVVGVRADVRIQVCFVETVATNCHYQPPGRLRLVLPGSWERVAVDATCASTATSPKTERGGTPAKFAAEPYGAAGTLASGHYLRAGRVGCVACTRREYRK